MSLLKYVERLKRMDELIRRNATGSAEEFSRKLRISKSQLFDDLREIRELGANISYCHVRKSYVYENDCKLILKFEENKHVKGGIFFDSYHPSTSAGPWLQYRNTSPPTDSVTCFVKRFSNGYAK